MNQSNISRQYGEMAIYQDGSVQVKGEPISIGPTARATLFSLIENAGSPVTRRLIASRTMRFGYEDRNSRSIDISISRLRKAIGCEGWRIQNIRNVGYRFDTSPNNGHLTNE